MTYNVTPTLRWCCAVNQYIALVLQEICNIGFEKNQKGISKYRNIDINYNIG